ncbi:hypothetical protein RM545_04195 [Zunongwangia sp. F260]|uniref:Uncharacterized protein n=1 Tax=Autumnicola lenta TaxID=3075593 RepID=A0ABU3CHR6_9FLAO|nr:hypothetical protein [Zunongwangia sp. F260]MDT0645879.1 hypothetical protein [Zunongwangia sp. F260]
MTNVFQQSEAVSTVEKHKILPLFGRIFLISIIGREAVIET